MAEKTADSPRALDIPWLGNIQVSSARRAVLKLVGGTGLAQMILLATTPIVTRIYTPGDFAILGLFMSFLGVALVFATMKLDFGIISARTDEEADYLLFLSLALSVLVGVTSIVALYGLRRWGVIGFAQLPLYSVPLIGPSITLTASFFSMRQWASRHTQFSALSRCIVGQGAGRGFSQVGFGFLQFGWMGLVLAELVARFVANAMLIKNAWPTLVRVWRSFQIRRLRVVFRRNYRFPLFCVPSTLVDTVAMALTAPLLIAFFGMAIGGAYVLIHRVLSLPISLFGRNVSDVFHQRLARCAHRGDGAALRLLDRTVLRLFLMSCIPIVLLFLFAESLVPLILGPNWVDAGIIASAIAPWLLAQFVITPVSQAASVYNSYHVKLIYDFTSLCSVVGSITICAAHTASYAVTIHVLAWTSALAYVLFYFLLRLIVKRA